MIRLVCLKELMLTKPKAHEIVLLVIADTFLTYILHLIQNFVSAAMI